MELTNCFAVPHAERGDEVAIGKDFNKQMLSLYLRANRKEQVVGWYASCAPDSGEIADTSSLIHEFYAGEVEEGSDPIHLVVDTRLCQGCTPRQGLQEYTSSSSRRTTCEFIS